MAWPRDVRLLQAAVHKFAIDDDDAQVDRDLVEILPATWPERGYFLCPCFSLPNILKSSGMYGGDDGARTRDLCRDRAAL